MSHIRWEPTVVGGKDGFSEWKHLTHAPLRMHETNGVTCPKCWHSDVRDLGEWDGDGADENESIRVFECPDCGCKWVNVYDVDDDGKNPTWKDFKLWENLLDEREKPETASGDENLGK